MLRFRLLIGPLLIAVVLASSWLDEWLTTQPLTPDRNVPPGVVIFTIICVVCVLAGRELATLLRAKGIESSSILTPTLAVLGLTTAALMPVWVSGVTGSAVTGTAVSAVLVGSLVYYSRSQKSDGMIAAAGGALLAFAYLGIMLGFLVLIRRDHSAWILLWVILTTKSCDIGAYFTGRAIGRRKLAPWLSPGKTWEGLFGGMAMSAVVGGGGVLGLQAVGLSLGPADTGTAMSFGWGALVGALFGLAGQLGDLMASLLKRDAGAKDSGSLVPGFGGVLDVIDSLVLVAPIAYWVLHTGYSAAVEAGAEPLLGAG